MMPLFVSIVLDGVGVGAQPDADAYGDVGSNTLGHVCAAQQPDLPNLQRLGLGNIAELENVEPTDEPEALFGRMREVSAGKDSTTGHWELAGLRLDAPFPTYPDGFPDEVIDTFLEATGWDGVLGNRAASGTKIVQELGTKHRETGYPIVYTSADSVFQIAAHKDVIPLDRLYELCRIAREDVCVGDHAVGRVIARPFVGTEGEYTRISSERKDFSRRPDAPPVQDVLQENGVRTVSVGKIYDLFARTGFDTSIKTKSNADGIRSTIDQIEAYAADPSPTFVWTNLVDFDQEYGHRNNPKGFADALETFDAALPDIRAALPDDAHLVITADHGNDPTTASTDHSREYVPLLYVAPRGPASGERDLGLRPSFNDHAATIADVLGVDFETEGTSFAVVNQAATP
ncbi:phosphopentomutase [Longibacter salinarum]|uniref:Phosphopentomutase n=2 Tax=Longibacter salinarum TaxID=1850348 RepID=A0A2A8CZK1_9BACT|nr:phosphopentomutase [Longibacter salinarum]